MMNSLINWVLTYSKRFILFILLITLAAGCFVYKNISVNTANTELLSKELTFRKNDIAFTKEFPQFSNNIIVVIESYSEDIAKDIASSFYKEIKKKEGELFNDIFYPEELDFFKKNGLLYLSEEELENSLDGIATYQPFISRLSQDQTIYGLLKTIDLFISADLNETDRIKIGDFLEQFTFVGCNTSFDSKFFCDGKDTGSLSWRNIFSKEPIGFKPPKKELIYLQPKLNSKDFFPSKDSLAFLENSIKKILTEYKREKMYERGSSNILYADAYFLITLFLS